MQIKIVTVIKKKENLHMKNRILSILLALALLCAILPTASLRASAATTSGTCGDNLTWTFDSATLEADLQDVRADREGLTVTMKDGTVFVLTLA